MLLGFKTELKLNDKQRTQFIKHCGVARHAWNWGLGLTKQILDNNKDNPNDRIKFPTAIDLHKWLIALVKPHCPWYYECSKTAPQEALRALRKAWEMFFKKKSGVPNFKKKGRKDCFTLEGAIDVDHRKIKLPKIGWIKTYERLSQGITAKSVTISRQADKWFASWIIEIEPTNKPKSKSSAIFAVADAEGVDYDSHAIIQNVGMKIAANQNLERVQQLIDQVDSVIGSDRNE